MVHSEMMFYLLQDVCPEASYKLLMVLTALRKLLVPS